MIANNGTIKLNNFGLRKLQEETGLSSLKDDMRNHSYQSPEQLRGEDIDFRSDIYSLGLIMEELLTGQTGIKFSSKESGSLRQYNENIPKSLEAIIIKMLHQDMNERFQSAGEILRELCKVKYKSLKPVIQELFPHMDLSCLLPGRELLDEKFTGKNFDEEEKKNGDKHFIGEIDPSKIKLDFRALDRICRGTGIRYKEAKDALIQAEGDSLKAIEIIATKRKGAGINVAEEILHEEMFLPDDNSPSEDFYSLWSRLFNGIFLIHKEEDLFNFPSKFLFLLIFIPFLTVCFNFLIVPFLIIFFLGIFSYIYFNLSFEIVDRDSFEFRKNVEMTLKHLSAPPAGQMLLNESPLPQLAEDIIPAQRERKKEVVPAEEKNIKETVPPSEEKSNARDRAARRRQEREKKIEDEPVAVEEKKESASTKAVPVKAEAAQTPEKTGPDQEAIKYICSRVEGITPEEAVKALEEENGDQSRAVMSLKKKKRAERKSVPQEEPQETPPPPEETPEPAPVPAPAAGGKIFDQEKIDYVCRRTKVTSEEAVKALEEYNGDEIEAVMSIKKNKRKQRK
jgi:NACalpha-BTF3-like transcription factor